MLDNTQGEHFELSNRLEAFDRNVPEHHSADPFACPCCVQMYLLRP